MQKTTNYGLNKPDQDDFYNVDEFNENADVIDAKLKEIEDMAGSASSDLKNHIESAENPHKVTKEQIGLGNVTNVSTNNQTPTYTVPDASTELESGEKLSTAFGKIAKAIKDLLAHIADTVVHITAVERTTWNAKQNAITGAATTITSSNLTANRALVSSSNGKVAASGITSTKLGYLSDVTSAIQAQLNNRLLLSGGTLTGNLKFSAGQQIYLQHGCALIFGNQSRVYSLSNQNFFLGASDEDYYFVFLGVRDGRWTLCPHKDGYVGLGTGTYRWGQIFSNASAISTSDRNEKNSIENLQDSWTKDFVMKLKPVRYKFNKGESDRYHCGLIAQDVEDTMNELNMTSKDFAGFIKSPKYKHVEFVDEDGNKQGRSELIEGEYTYGLRYEEFIAPLIKMVQEQQKEIDELKKLIK